MGILVGFLIGILILCALLLVVIILIQDDGSEGAGMIFGSAASQQYGVRKGNIVTRTTGILATVFMVLAFSLAFFLTDRDDTKSLQAIAEKKQSTDNTTIKWWEESEKSSVDEDSENAKEAADENNSVESSKDTKETADESDEEYSQSISESKPKSE